MSIQSPTNQKKDNPNIFVASNLCWKVGKISILKTINLAIKKNKITGFIGPNGAGKSSLLRCFFAKNKITAGSLTFNNRNISEYSRRELAQNIAVVLQEPPTQFDMDVFELVSLGLIPNLKLLSFPSTQDKKRVIDALTDVGLSDKRDCSFNTLSGGEKQRVMLARAIVQQTKILILDEPTNHLDIQHQIEILQLVKKLEITVILSIHDLNMASIFCDELVLMNEGEIVAIGDNIHVLTEKNLKDVFRVNATIEINASDKRQKINYDLSQIESKADTSKGVNKVVDKRFDKGI